MRSTDRSTAASQVVCKPLKEDLQQSVRWYASHRKKIYSSQPGGMQATERRSTAVSQVVCKPQKEDLQQSVRWYASHRKIYSSQSGGMQATERRSTAVSQVVFVMPCIVVQYLSCRVQWYHICHIVCSGTIIICHVLYICSTSIMSCIVVSYLSYRV